MVPALAAGGHYDPSDSKRHDTPWGDGHLGDLPPLFVDAEGNANQPVFAPRLKMADLAVRSLPSLGSDSDILASVERCRSNQSSLPRMALT